ncbi:MAG: hypothetical protein HOU81_02780 [Hamadaea sp.]|uniref:hypothetical protein n=1 Tax=Hamadaea sp. TaxID=2024425 RepID=UPI0017B6BA1E|nr:hypothetical protein [Hamadaea sp.]NUR69720.1 hypothetical protein [Hamadaea sp.]NUT23491.1 hypothetical protein [Hamadaea sp.]
MTALDCPQCSQPDQVQSVRSVYESQSGTYSGVSTGVTSGVGFAGGRAVPVVGRTVTRTSGRTSTLLADTLAPPPVPAMPPQRGGVLIGLALAAPVLAGCLTVPLLASGADHAVRNAVIFWAAIGGPFLVVAIALIVYRITARQRARRAYDAYSAIYPAQSAVWNAAFFCGRCNLAFLPVGALGVPGRHQTVAPQFQYMVTTVAAQLRP